PWRTRTGARPGLPSARHRRAVSPERGLSRMLARALCSPFARRFSAAVSAVAFGVVLLSSPPEAKARPISCDPALVASAVAAVEAACPCDGAPDGNGGTVPWGKHRHYKKCVHTTIRDQVRASNLALPRRCLRTTLRCGNKSTCGTVGAVTCTTADACFIAPSAAACDASGATLGTGSCCAPEPLVAVE